MDDSPATTRQPAEHWDAAYDSRGDTGVSWFEPEPVTSLDLIDGLGAPEQAAVIDFGGGASRLVDGLLSRGFSDVTVLDLSAQALACARARLTGRADQVTWVAADVRGWVPPRTYAVWHDRAVFHFLADEEDRRAYRRVLTAALEPGGYVVIGTFALDGPDACSGLPVVRYDANGLSAALGEGFTVVTSRTAVHETPWHSHQPFTWVVLRRDADGTGLPA